MFLGGVEDALQRPDAALTAYDAAAARLPRAQTARLAASEVRYRTGERQAAADASGGMAPRDATYAALALADIPTSRSLLLVFSDGLDTASWISAAEVERVAAQANAVVYGVTVAAASRPFDIGAAQYVKGQTAFLDAVAEATGGRVLRADAATNLPAAFDEILREFRTRYVLTYSPHGANTPGWHRIELRVKGRHADVRARWGYER